eukprot:11418765-Alexandrium_andersonii.AAC.1
MGRLAPWVVAPACDCGRERQPERAPVEQHVGAVAHCPGQWMVDIHWRSHSAHAGRTAGVCWRVRPAGPRPSPGP